MIPLKTDYNKEAQNRLREQYKNSKHVNGIINILAKQAQELEDASHEIYNLNNNFGIFKDPQNRIDSILRTARMFSVHYGDSPDVQDLIDRIKTNVYVLTNKPSINSLEGLSFFVYEFQSHVHESRFFIDVTVQGNISEDSGRRAKILRDGYLKLMPTSFKIHHVIESTRTDFSFEEFRSSEGFSFFDLNNQRDSNAGMSRVILNENGDYIGA